MSKKNSEFSLNFWLFGLTLILIELTVGISFKNNPELDILLLLSLSKLKVVEELLLTSNIFETLLQHQHLTLIIGFLDLQ